MASKVIFTSDRIGYIGECYVAYKLSQMGLKAQPLFNFHEFDFLVENGWRIEVKSARAIQTKDKRKGEDYRRPVFNFNNHTAQWTFKDGMQKNTFIKRDRQCDFFVLVCLGKNFEVLKTYIVPKKIIGNRMVITIPANPRYSRKGSIFEYEEKWEQLR